MRSLDVFFSAYNSNLSGVMNDNDLAFRYSYMLITNKKKDDVINDEEHNSGSFLWFQILLTFVATICTAFMAVSFLDMEIYKTTIIYYSAMLSLVFGLMFTSEKQKKACFYNVFMKFTAILSSLVLVVIMLFSAITGFTRPESFAKYRHDISTAVSNFSL